MCIIISMKAPHVRDAEQLGVIAIINIVSAKGRVSQPRENGEVTAF
jgi:hypothetical protein